MIAAKFPIFPTVICLVLPWGMLSCRQEPSAAVAESSMASAATPTADGLPEVVTFNAHIRPIFSDSCFSCHGFDAKTREAGLRLDTPEGAYAALIDSESKFAIVPGDPDRSEVLARIVTQDPDLQMPPPTFHKDPLDEREVALVRRWIKQGAKYEKHWSFEPVRRVEPPVPAKHAQQVANPIDSFILDRLAREGIEPSPVAPRETLLRRLSLDLTGLPPSPEDVAAFVSDDSPDAWRNLVDRLLASPRYGERMAVWWLDVARYADTVGYHGDQNSRVFPYRDYVIKAFNENKPFDRFTMEQLAGDLLENPTDEQLIATGFLRLNLMTREGGAQPGEYLAKYMGDRIRALGGAWLGLTTGCAECHDHKFDPISAKDYYSLGAFFSDVRQWGVYQNYDSTPNPELKGWNNQSPFPPEIHLRNPALQQRIEMLRAETTDLLANMNAPANEIATWANHATGFLKQHPDGWQKLIPSGAEVTGDGCQATIANDGSVVITGAPAKDGKVVLRLPLPDAPIRSIRFEALPDEANDGFVGRAADGRFAVKTAFAIEDAKGAAKLAIAWSQADKRQPHGYNVMGDLNPTLENEWRSGPAHLEFPRDAARHPQHAVFHLAEPLPAAAGRVLTVTMDTHDLGRARFSVTPFGGTIPGYANAHRDSLGQALATPAAKRNDAQQREIAAAYFHGTRPENHLPDGYAALRDAILECRAGYAHSMIVETLPEEKLIPVHYLPRGDWMNPGEKIQAALPGLFAGASTPRNGERLTRIDLANWLMAPENPLTTRHFTNRLWHAFFGRGLSGIVDDLGSQGEMPSHPELLDWLASEFRQSGWDVKHMVRLIVTSNTYQREAATRDELLEKDPGNRLLASQSARRLDAEFVRDNALSIAGLLRHEIIGGPSAKPYQPEGYYDNLNFPIRDYHASTGAEQYRRGLYMHWQRTFLHPMLAAFDAPSREECTPTRFQANSPQQALVLLNDPTFVEAARAFAERLLREKSGTGDDARIRHALLTALAREPRSGEMDSLRKFLAEQRDHYAKQPAEAEALLRTGLSGGRASGSHPELAAWTQLCRVILNLHETITRY